jgi:cytochrome P450
MSHADAPAIAAPKHRFSELKAPRGLPVVGSALTLALDPSTAHLSFERWARELGTPYRVRLGSRYMLVIDDATEIARIMKARPGAFRRVRPLESVFAEMGIAGVFSAEGADWERQRRLVMRAFDPSKLRHYFPSLERVTERLKNRFAKASAKGEWLDLQAEFMRYTVDVTAGLAFGVDTNTIESGEDRIQAHLDKIFPAINRRMTAPFAYWRTVKLPSDRALDHDLAKVREAIDSYIAQARARMAAEPERATNPQNLIEALLAARDSNSESASGFTDADVSGNVFTALLAGEDTTANTLAWLCHYLSKDAALQAKVRNEVTPFLSGSHEDTMQAFMDADRMPLLDACIKEAMRLKPVAVLLSHESNEATEVQGISIRARTPVCTLLRPAGMQPELFPEPQAFRPERWTDPQSLGLSDAQIAQAKRALMPFGAGPRFCPGRYLAMLEIKMVTAMLVHGFRLEPGGKPVTERYALSMMPSGLRVRLGAHIDACASAP